MVCAIVFYSRSLQFSLQYARTAFAQRYALTHLYNDIFFASTLAALVDGPWRLGRSFKEVKVKELRICLRICSDSILVDFGVSKWTV
jgi:hypothetical protein